MTNLVIRMISTRAPDQPKSRILIVDDHPLIREGMSALIALQPDIEVCGEADNVNDALAKAKMASPDLVIVDIALADSHGLDLIKEIRARFPLVKMLVVSAFDESLYAERSLRAGAHGYVNKREAQDTIIDAIYTVLEGERYISADLTSRLVGQAVSRIDPAETEPFQRLTDRELEVFRLIGQGKSTSTIARQLHLSIHTIETHREKIRHKLSIKTGTELMHCAIRWVLENG